MPEIRCKINTEAGICTRGNPGMLNQQIIQRVTPRKQNQGLHSFLRQHPISLSKTTKFLSSINSVASFSRQQVRRLWSEFGDGLKE